MDLPSFLAKNWDVIAEAPQVFILWTLVLLAACWYVVNHLKANQISTLRERLSLRDDELSDYKRRLQGASPEEADQRIQTLENELRSLRPRELTLEQIDRIKSCLRSQGSAKFFAEISSNDGTIFSDQMACAFKESGWTVSTGVVAGLGSRPPSGMAVYVHDTKTVSTPAAMALSAFEAAGLNFDVRANPQYSPDFVEVIIATPATKVQ